MNKTFKTLMYRGHTCVIDKKGLREEDFDSLEDLRRLQESFDNHKYCEESKNFSSILTTKEAWHKYESMLFSPEELNGMMKFD